MQIMLGHASRPFQNQPPCGDGWLELSLGRSRRLMLADGLGHGRRAHQIVEDLQQQLNWISQRSVQENGLVSCMEQLHSLLLQQGHESQAAVALLDLHTDAHQLEMVSIGNIQISTLEQGHHQCFANLHGMVGGRLPHGLKVSRWPMRSPALLCLLTDGVETHRALEYLQSISGQGMLSCLDLQLEAEAVIERFGKLSDDASCALIRWSEEPA